MVANMFHWYRIGVHHAMVFLFDHKLKSPVSKRIEKRIQKRIDAKANGRKRPHKNLSGGQSNVVESSGE